MIDLELEEPEDKQGSEEPVEESIEAAVVDAIEDELTDEQLMQMAEGSCSWGANCNHRC